MRGTFIKEIKTQDSQTGADSRPPPSPRSAGTGSQFAKRSFYTPLIKEAVEDPQAPVSATEPAQPAAVVRPRAPVQDAGPGRAAGADIPQPPSPR